MYNDRFANGFVNMARMLTSPKEIFARTEKKPVWLAYFFMIIGTMLIRFLYFPFYRQLLISSLHVGPSPIQVELAEQSTRRLALLSALTSPLSLTIEILFITVVIWLIVQLLTSDPGFSRLLSMVVYCQCVIFLASVLTIIILYARGIPDVVTSPTDFEVSLGIDLLLSKYQFRALFNKALSQINIFSIWWAVLIYTGLIQVARLSKTKAIMVTSFLWSFKFSIQMGIYLLTYSITKVS